MARRTLLFLASATLLAAGCADADEARDTDVNGTATTGGPVGVTPSPTAAALADARDGVF